MKNFYNPVELATRFAEHELDVIVREIATYFLYGYGTYSQANADFQRLM